MQRLATVASVAAALLLASVALAAATPAGTYKTKITSNAAGGALKGTWTVKFASPAYTVTDNGTVVVHGKYSIKGTTITFNDKSGRDVCPGPGKYAFKLSGTKLNLTLVSDSNPACLGRRVVLAGSFTKIG
jgi:hypothetical protein